MSNPVIAPPGPVMQWLGGLAQSKQPLFPAKLGESCLEYFERWATTYKVCLEWIILRDQTAESCEYRCYAKLNGEQLGPDTVGKAATEEAAKEDACRLLMQTQICHATG
ncbi:hypothetical protein FRC12_014609 [Ceratobasidium sp. 428]|nr:hypothetical protein FRC12_014609 [Ceratobasidium sp. 428]